MNFGFAVAAGVVLAVIGGILLITGMDAAPLDEMRDIAGLRAVDRMRWDLLAGGSLLAAGGFLSFIGLKH